MCGIAACCPSDGEFISFALRAQRQRGPDEEARRDLGFCALGVNRLAISGVADGHQPFCSEDGCVTAVFNGALYNAMELARRLGVSLRSRNDGEIITHLYQRFGLGFADQLEGMFSICIADATSRNLVYAVDRLGIKPLYVSVVDANTYVASTPEAFPPRLWVGLQRVPPGTVWSSTGDCQLIRSRGRPVGSLGDALRESVAEQIPSEVKWGCMLSGGVDSALIARLAAEISPAVRTFTCGTSGSEDLAAARDVADAVESSHEVADRELDDGVLAMLGLHEREWLGAVGQEREVPPVGKRLRLRDDQTGATHDQALAGDGRFGDLRFAACGVVRERLPSAVGHRGDRVLDRGLAAHADRVLPAGLLQAGHQLGVPERRIAAKELLAGRARAVDAGKQLLDEAQRALGAGGRALPEAHVQDLAGVRARGEHRVIAALAGVAERGALLAVAVNLADEAVDIDDQPSRAGSGPGVPRACQRDARHAIELAHVPERERAQKRTERRRRRDPAAQQPTRCDPPAARRSHRCSQLPTPSRRSTP